MTRVLLWVGVIITSIVGSIATFIDHTEEWVRRLDAPNTYTSISTTTHAPIPEVTLTGEAIPTTTPRAPSTTASSIAPTSPPPTSSSLSAKKTVVKAPIPVLITPPAPEAPQRVDGRPETQGVINEKAIIDLTNVERVREGAGILAWNEKLAQMAYIKAKDMLDRQYFAHESPDGKNVAGLAENIGYAYRLVGENLAVGNFRTNEELIAGWMGSPGHRENIVKEEYTEMGAAAIEGTFEGARVWMAVQEFGRPFPSCPKPDPAQKKEIETMNTTLSSLNESIDIARGAIEGAGAQDVRTQKISDYNQLIDLYNSLVVTLKTTIVSYNESVRAYNLCVGE